jgi:nucleotidyltransferase/DNA polymerase involved in DNA repair
MPMTCVLIPRFRLLCALEETGDARRRMLSRAIALAPEPGTAQLVGEVSGPAEAAGVRIGMRVGEALGRCPELAFLPADPDRAERAWEEALRRLEGIGAEVESGSPGEAFFELDGLRGLWGGMDGVLARVRRELGPSARLAAAPGRFCAFAAARRARADRPSIVPAGGGRRFLSPLPTSLLHGRLRPWGRERGGGTAVAEVEVDAEDLPNELERLGIDTLGRLAGLDRDAVADRFGRLGLRARSLARGKDTPLRPRPMREALAVELELPDAVSGPQLERALDLLIARLLAHPERRGRAVRALRLSARLAAGGGWRREVALRSAATKRGRIADALRPQLELLPSPASLLRLQAVGLGTAAGDQLSLASPEEDRRRRISEAVRQTRAAAGSEAVLQVLEVDPDSRIPERRAVLMPFPEQDSS